MNREELRAFDTDQEFAVWVLKRAGLTAEVHRNQEWRVGGRTLTVCVWIDHEYRYVLLVRSGWPPPEAPESISLGQVFAMACADEVLDFKRDGRKSPQLSRWKAKALIDSGKKDAPRVEMKALPNDAPESARQTWPVVRSLVEVRRLLDDDDDMPLVVPFLRRWCERTVPEDTLIAGRRWLDRHGYIEHAGEIPTGAGKPMVLWKVACLPRHEQAILDDLYDLLGAREVEA